MYTLCIRRDFIARHALIGGDWGLENLPHSHPYGLELQLEGDHLDEHGFLVDIVNVEACLGELVARYKDALLNDLPQFSGLNPSLEHFSRIACLTLNEKIEAANLTALKVVLWESDSAWASYRVER